MPAIATTADGAYIYAALEDSATGNQIIARAARGNLSTWTSVYDPGGGSAGNVAPAPSDSDVMYFYGNFGTDKTVIKHSVSAVTNSDISPASLGAKVVNTLSVDPSDADRIVISVGTDQDLLYTEDGGANWTLWEAALGFDATAKYVIWGGLWYPARLFVAGHDGLNAVLLYSPNEMASEQDEASAALQAASNIVAVEVAAA